MSRLVALLREVFHLPPAPPAGSEPGALARAAAEAERAFKNGCRQCHRSIPAGEACVILRWTSGRMEVECIDCGRHKVEN